MQQQLQFSDYKYDEEQARQIEEKLSKEPFYPQVLKDHPFEIANLIEIDMSSPKETIIQQLMESLEKTGFFYLKNIEGFDYKQLYYSSQWFFSQPEELKRKLAINYYEKENKNFYRGFFPLCYNDPSYKEFLEFGDNSYTLSGEIKKTQSQLLYEKLVYPANGQQFQDFMQSYWQLFSKLGIKITRYLALGLGLKEDFFDKWFLKENDADAPELSTFRISHYPPRSTDTVSDSQNIKEEDGVPLTNMSHCDSVFLTFLNTFNNYGLQVLQDEKWKTVKPNPNYIIVNIGKMLSRICNDRIIATMHRVIDIGVDRYSVPFFFEPKYNARIPLNLLENDSRDQGTYEEIMVKRIQIFVEYRGFSENYKAIQQQYADEQQKQV